MFSVDLFQGFYHFIFYLCMLLNVNVCVGHIEYSLRVCEVFLFTHKLALVRQLVYDIRLTTMVQYYRMKEDIGKKA